MIKTETESVSLIIITSEKSTMTSPPSPGLQFSHAFLAYMLQEPREMPNVHYPLNAPSNSLWQRFIMPILQMRQLRLQESE